MPDIIAADWNGAPFILFGRAHLIGLLIVALSNAGLILLGRRATAPLRKGLRIGLAVFLLLVETSWHAWNAYTGQWTIQTMLPLHLCSILVWLSALMLLTRNERIYEFAYLLGIAGALQALLTPDAGIYGYPHYRFFQVLASHGAIIAGALYMTLVEGYRPSLQSVKRVLIGSNLYLLAVFGLNFILGSNYLFIRHKPETASLLDVLPAWPWYIAVIELLGVLFIALAYAPFAAADLRGRRASARECGG